MAIDPQAPARDLSGVAIRRGGAGDLPRLVEIYNHYIIHTPITFALEPITVEQRRPWLEQFSDSGRYQLFVAEEEGRVAGWAGSHHFRDRRAYDQTIEATVYLAPESTGRGIGTLLYRTLFDALPDGEIHRAIAGITLPNDASVAIHERFGFTLTGVMHEVGYKFDRYWDVGWYERRLG